MGVFYQKTQRLKSNMNSIHTQHGLFTMFPMHPHFQYEYVFLCFCVLKLVSLLKKLLFVNELMDG